MGSLPACRLKPSAKIWCQADRANPQGVDGDAADAGLARVGF
jgi:hypothetical protein